MAGGLRSWCLLVGPLLLALWASTASAEDDRKRRHRDDAADEGGEAESRESARERRRKRKEERERQKAEKAASESADEASADPDGPGDAAPEGITSKGETPTAAPPSTPRTAEPTPVPLASQDTLYTSRDVLDGEGPLDPAKLPPPYQLALTQSSPEQLRRLDGRLMETVDVLQAGGRCEALRGASRVPFRTWMWREHQREIFVGVGLFVLAFCAAFMWPSPAMRALLPIIPLVGCAYVGWDSSNRASAMMDSIARGLRACSTALDEGDPSRSTVVRNHVEQVTRMSASIDAAYEQDDSLVGRVMSQYKM